ncbi:MAG: hypothetical protein IPI46_06730 [Bacteroidetes bacterium]|nr:hypothetical protein [Bacteroidota bacterium]
MKKIATLLSLQFILSISIHAQSMSSQDSLNIIYTYLKRLYESSNTYFDTSRINFRRESQELIERKDSTQQLIGNITLGLLNLYGNQRERSIVNFKKALQIDSTCFLCYDKLHWLYWYTKANYGEANRYLTLGIKQYEKLIQTDSSDVERWAKLYNMYSLNEGTIPVKTKLRMNYISEKMVKMAPENAYYWWQNSFHHQKDSASEEYALIRANDLSPNTTIFWNALANFYTEHKNLEKMLVLMEAAKPNKNDDMHYWYQQMALYLYRLGKKTEASNIAKEAKLKGYQIVYK